MHNVDCVFIFIDINLVIREINSEIIKITLKFEGDSALGGHLVSHSVGGPLAGHSVGEPPASRSAGNPIA